jgi:hypothetical protein
VLGLLSDLELTLSDCFEGVRGGGAFAALAGRQAGAQLEGSAFLVGQRRAREGVVLAAFDHRPAQAHQLAGGGDDRDLGAAAGADTLKERPQRARRSRGSERGLDQHPASVSPALLGDPAMAGGLVA